MATATPIKVAKPTGVVRAKNPASAALMEPQAVDSRHAFVPDAKYGRQYVHRTVNGIKDFTLLDHCMGNHLNLLLKGDTGAGKTMFPMAYAAERRIPYYTVPCDVSIDPSALFGKMMPTNRLGEFEWQDGPVTEMVRYGGVLNISEINFMPSKIAASLYSLLDHRRSIQLLGHNGEHVVAHPDLLVVADMNPKYRGTMDLNLALANRFAIKVPWGYEAAVEDKLVRSKSLLSLVRKIRELEEFRTPIGTNLMLEFMDAAADLGMKFATANFLETFADTEKPGVDKIIDLASEEIAKEVAAYRIASNKGDLEGIQDLEEDASWKVNSDDYELEEVK